MQPVVISIADNKTRQAEKEVHCQEAMTDKIFSRPVDPFHKMKHYNGDGGNAAQPVEDQEMSL